MKRLLLTLAGLLLASIAFAQSLNGTWVATQAMDQQKDSANVSMKVALEDYITFTIEGLSCTSMEKVILVINASDDKNDLNMGATITVNAPGTLVRDGDILTITPAKKPKPEVKVEVQNIPGIMKALLVNPIKKEIEKSLKEPSKYRIISLTDSEMVLEDILTEKEIKKGDKPEKTTFTRQN